MNIKIISLVVSTFICPMHGAVLPPKYKEIDAIKTELKNQCCRIFKELESLGLGDATYIEKRDDGSIVLYVPTRTDTNSKVEDRKYKVDANDKLLFLYYKRLDFCWVGTKNSKGVTIKSPNNSKALWDFYKSFTTLL